MNIKFDKKFTNKELDEYIDGIYRNIKSKPFDKYLFDLSDVEYIGNQELLVLSALFKSFAESKIKFEVLFFEPDIPPNDRVKRQIIEIWDVWKIWKTVPPHESREYFGIDRNIVDRFKRELNYYPKLSEIYSRNGVTPFVFLDYINNYSEIEVQQKINPIYRLNSVIKELLEKNKCHHPFASQSLSTIITEELYLNFLDHSIESSVPNCPKMAFMSISFHRKLDEKGKTAEEIQKIKKLNFESEWLAETKPFFFDAERDIYKNEPYIEFSFLDFGKGIVNTLKEHFLQENKLVKNETIDSDILKYSFNHYSSRQPIYNAKNKIEKFIPRGLFDALTIVKRYKGLLIVRSNFGKILFDFSNHSDIDKAFAYFGNNTLFFPGTLISLYIPAIEDDSKINISTIKPEIEFANIKPRNKKYINMNTIVKKLDVQKEDLYQTLLQELRDKILDKEKHFLVFVNFKGCEIEKRIIKKTIYFLLTDYEINHRNNVVILNSPNGSVIEDIALEILTLSAALRNYKIHPLPIIDFDENSEDVKVKWLGIYDESDQEKLKNLLYKEYSVAKSDFIEPANVIGHLNEFDKFGNLISNFPNKDKIIQFFRLENQTIISRQVEELLSNHECIKKNDGKNLYLSSGNYYQKEFVELDNLVNDKVDCNIITNLLFNKLIYEIGNLADFRFIALTTNSYKILKSLESQNLISKADYIYLDNYHNLENDLTEENIDANKKYILICHVISTGFMTDRLNSRLNELGARVDFIAVITSVMHSDFKLTKSFIENYGDRIFSLHQYPIRKFMPKDLMMGELLSKTIIRINPFTNIPIRLSINETYFKESVIFQTDINHIEGQNVITIQNRFLDNINEDAINVGFMKFNNVIHPYFFDTKKILRELPDDLLKDIFNIIGKSDFEREKIRVFYPKESGIDFFNFEQLKAVLKNHAIEETEIERFGTNEGWKFPHNSEYLNNKIENSFCFILDDGSCSGDSLIQMIDEISFNDAREIVLLCFIGRVKNHKREFFSRLNSIKVKGKTPAPISIFFVCHWHIPTYPLDENPNIKETNWLNDIINLQNTPRSIKEIARSIRSEITPKNHKGFTDHKYLPKTKNTNKIPKKELLIVRDELGKVIGYRLYKESFAFFDFFMKKYLQVKPSKDRYKEIELLCATFVYEPYLYDKIVDVLPDVVERIEEFVRVLITKPKIYESLTYKWSKKEILHLFFIVFKDKKLTEELTIERFKQLIEFTQQGESTINYILYKLLFYFPMTTSQFNEKKFDSKIKERIIELKNDESISNKEVKKYYNFITSLPSRRDFESQLSRLKANYEKQKEPEFHDEKKSFNHNVSELIVTIREINSDIKDNKSFKRADIRAIKRCWFNILDFINPILTFSSSFKEFLLPYTDYMLANQVISLREMVGFIEDTIQSSNESLIDLEKLETVKKYVGDIQFYFELNATFHQVIENHQSNLIELLTSLKTELEKAKFKVSEVSQPSLIEKSTINIPKLYVEKLLISELVVNMKKYCKKSVQIELEYNSLNDEQFQLTITNVREHPSSKISNGEGTKCLMLMSDCEIFGFKYKSKEIGEKYIQTLIFNLN